MKNLYAPRRKVLIQVSTADTLAHAALMHQLSKLTNYWKDSVSIEVRYSFDGYLKGLQLYFLMAAKSRLSDESIADHYVFNKTGMVNWNLQADYTF